MVCKPQEIIHFHVHNLDFSPLANAIKRATERNEKHIYQFDLCYSDIYVYFKCRHR